jgi:hypothetical protein
MMLTTSLRDPFAHLFADCEPVEVKSALRPTLRPRRTLADRVRAALQGLAGGHPGATRVHPRAAYRLHLCGDW